MKYDNELKLEVITSLDSAFDNLEKLLLYKEHIAKVFSEICVSLNPTHVENLNNYISEIAKISNCIATEMDKILCSQDEIKSENRGYKISDIISQQ